MSTNHVNQQIRPGAYLNGAIRFCRSAGILLDSLDSSQTTLFPAYFLYCHAAELALKGFLAFSGEDTDALKKRWGHDLEKLLTDAVNRGLKLPLGEELDYRNVISLLESGNLDEGFRYFTFKSTNRPEISWAAKTVNALIALIEEQIGHRRGPAGPAVKIDIVMSQPEPTPKSIPSSKQSQ